MDAQYVVTNLEERGYEVQSKLHVLSHIRPLSTIACLTKYTRPYLPDPSSQQLLVEAKAKPYKFLALWFESKKGDHQLLRTTRPWWEHTVGRGLVAGNNVSNVHQRGSEHGKGTAASAVGFQIHSRGREGRYVCCGRDVLCHLFNTARLPKKHQKLLLLKK